MMPAGARARSFSRPFGLNFAFAPRSACFKGQEKQTPLPIHCGGPERGGATEGAKKPRLRCARSGGHYTLQVPEQALMCPTECYESTNT